jgi:large subunit ribosomal protein L18
LIDDLQKKTIISAKDTEIDLKKKDKISIAKEVGSLLAKKAVEKKIKEAVFDRGGYKYHGRVKSLAEGAREGGLKF